MKKYTFIPALIAAVILAQTLFFKFTAHPESVALFTALGVEPWGRLATGFFELIAAILLIIPRFRVLGALVGAGLMVGAIGSHLFVVGIESNGDGGFLFILALVVMFCCGLILLVKKDQFAEFARGRFDLTR